MRPMITCVLVLLRIRSETVDVKEASTKTQAEVGTCANITGILGLLLPGPLVG